MMRPRTRNGCAPCLEPVRPRPETEGPTREHLPQTTPPRGGAVRPGANIGRPAQPQSL